MPDWNRPRRVRNMRKVLRQQGAKPPKGCQLWVLIFFFAYAVVMTVAGAYGMRGR